MSTWRHSACCHSTQVSHFLTRLPELAGNPLCRTRLFLRIVADTSHSTPDDRMRRLIVVGGRSAEEVTPLRLHSQSGAGGRAHRSLSLISTSTVGRVVATAEADKGRAEKKARRRETRNLLVRILLTVLKSS